MIYTVTLNPAVDLVVDADKITFGAVNRLSDEQVFFGGKGINVSVILNELGAATKALGFAAGFTGAAIEQSLREKGIPTDFVHLPAGFSRINIKIRAGDETELNAPGPDIDERSLSRFFETLGTVSNGDTVVLAGSAPKSLPEDIYEQIAERVSKRGTRIVADASGKLLTNVLKYRPFLIKPNIHELGGIFGVTLNTADEAASYARKLREMGAVNVLVSMGGAGALLIDENGEEHRSGVCSGTVRSSVGAGDSMVAGFLAGCEKGDYEYALRLGTACGGATAFSEGLADRRKIEEMLNELRRGE